MIKNPFTKPKVATLEEQIETWSDEECLENFSKFLDRVTISSDFLQDEEGEMYTHEQLVVSCGDKFFTSDPQEMDWPLQMLPMPEAFKGVLN